MGLLKFLNNPINLFYFAIAILVAITVHEFMHAWTANYLGDSTPGRAGRISLNPFDHLDILGTISLFLLGIGWGKPVPINPNNFKNPRLGSALTALAGPVSNLLVALAFSIIGRVAILPNFWTNMILAVVYYNVLLMLFNLLPIPPLDGSKFFALFIPGLDSPQFEQVGPFVLIAFLVFGGFALISPVLVGVLNLMGISVNQLSFLFI